MERKYLFFFILISLILIVSARLNLLEHLNDDWIDLPKTDGTFERISKAELEQRYERIKYDDYDPLKEVKFFLFTQKNIDEGQVIEIYNKTSFENSDFNSENPTRFLIHGWSADINHISIQEPKKSYLQKASINCIGVDWSTGAATTDYALAAERTLPVGVVVANFIGFLLDQLNVSIKDFSVIGHSLGAHIAGFAGKNIPVPNSKLPTLVALDPAANLFWSAPPDKRVDKGDANYVEVIHSCIRLISIADPIGHSDFYPSGGGPRQPGCGEDPTGGCAHARAVLFFAESITTEIGFFARKCDSFASVQPGGCNFVEGIMLMGGEPINDFDKVGVWWLDTWDSPPFAKGLNGKGGADWLKGIFMRKFDEN